MDTEIEKWLSQPVSISHDEQFSINVINKIKKQQKQYLMVKTLVMCLVTVCSILVALIFNISELTDMNWLAQMNELTALFSNENMPVISTFLLIAALIYLSNEVFE